MIAKLVTIFVLLRCPPSVWSIHEDDIEGYIISDDDNYALAVREEDLQCPSENVIETRYRCKVRIVFINQKTISNRSI
jgi:hypothetical protein